MTIVIGIKRLKSIDAVIRMYKALGVELTEEEVRSYPNNEVETKMQPKIEGFTFEPKYNPYAGEGVNTIGNLPLFRILFGISIPNGSELEKIAQVNEILEKRFKSLGLPPVLVYIANFDE